MQGYLVASSDNMALTGREVYIRSKDLQKVLPYLAVVALARTWNIIKESLISGQKPVVIGLDTINTTQCLGS